MKQLIAHGSVELVTTLWPHERTWSSPLTVHGSPMWGSSCQKEPWVVIGTVMGPRYLGLKGCDVVPPVDSAAVLVCSGSVVRLFGAAVERPNLGSMGIFLLTIFPALSL